MIDRTHTLIGILALLLSACADPRPFFGDLPDSVWVDSSGVPENLKFGDDYSAYGTDIAAIGPADPAGVRFVVASNIPDRNGAAVAAYASDGTFSTDDGSLHTGDPLIVAGDRSGANDADSFAIGVPGALKIGGTVEMVITGAPTAMAFGPTNVDATNDTVDLYAISGDALSFVPDYANAAAGAAASCTLSAPATSLTIADVDSLSPEHEVIVGLTGGSIVVMNGATIAAGAGGACDSTPSGTIFTLATTGGDATGLVSGHFDASAPRFSDLVVVAGGTVTVYMDVDLPADANPSGTALDLPGASDEVGAALAVGNLSADPGQELFIGDPGMAIDGVSGAGGVFIRGFDDGGAQPDESRLFHDFSPETNQSYGRAITVADWDGDIPVLVVGASAEVFTYFKTYANQGDPRP